MFTVFASNDRNRVAEVARAWSASPWTGPGHVPDARPEIVVRSTKNDYVAADAAGTLACGRARLDNEPGAPPAKASRGSDIRRILAAYAEEGIEGVTALHGAYGIVLWDAAARTLYAVRDALGVNPLYYAARGDGILVADSAEDLDPAGEIDPEFVAVFIATGRPHVTRTIWRDVAAVPPGSLLSWRAGEIRIRRHWRADALGEPADRTSSTTEGELRALIVSAVVQHLDPGGGTWADLSGGHDSSSVACVAAASAGEHASRRLGGALTYTDSIGNGDETVFADAVLQRYGIRNERIADDWPWRDDGEPPPVTPLPSRDYPYYARDRLVARTLRRHGARSLLSGIGPDYYLPHTARHAADLVWTGRVREGARLVLEWSVARRERLWRTAPRLLLMPLAPVSVQVWSHARRHPPPDWFRPEAERQHGFREHLADERVDRCAPGDILRAAVAGGLTRMSASLQGWRNCPGIEIRHPLLTRRLVEYCLRLPYADRVDVNGRKPALRRAMRGIVPDVVLDRRTKGSARDARACWAFGRERARIARLIGRSILAEHGFVDPARLLQGADRAAAGADRRSARFVFNALSLDTWLAVRRGRFDKPAA